VTRAGPLAGTRVCSQAVFHLPEKKKRKKNHKCFKQQPGSTSPCLAPFDSHSPPWGLPYLPAMPQLPGLAGQAAAQLQQAARSTKGNRNSAFWLHAFESCSAEPSHWKPVPRRDQHSWRMLCSTWVCFSHLGSLSSEEGHQGRKSEVLHGQPRELNLNDVPIKSK